MSAHPTPGTLGGLSPERIAQIRDSGPPIMRQAADYEATAPAQRFGAKAGKPIAVAPLSVANTRLYREVFGFAFASSLGDPTIGYPSWNFSLLSTVAYFGIHIAWTGQFSSDSGLSTWDDPYGPVPAFISTAHAHGTKVVLTIELFDSSAGTLNMCDALVRGSTTIQAVVNEVKSKGIDGVNIDYESNNTSCLINSSTGAHEMSQTLFTTFVANMRAALPSGSYLSVDTYSGAAGYRSGSTYYGFFDIGSLNNYVDSFFVMAYDMEYSNYDSAPLYCSSFCIGPTAPLTTYLFNDGRASSEYSAVVPPSKVIMGIPYYGRKECVPGYTPTNAPPNAAGTAVAADGYLDASTENGYYANSNYQIHREVHDTAGATRWDTFTSSTANCTREMYWDDVTALGNKYNLVITNHLRGIGIFALNYGGGAPELWSLINQKFGQCSQGAISADLPAPQIPGTTVTFTGSALCAGTAEYRFSIAPPGGSFSVVQAYSTASTYAWNTTGQAVGTYTIQVEVRNLGNTTVNDTYARMAFRLALCVTPSLTSSLPSPQLPGTAITLTSSVTCSSTPEFQFSEQAPGGVWTVVQPYGSSSSFNWNTTAAAFGGYSFMVSARTAGTTVAAESTQSIPYSLTSCISAALTTDKDPPQPTGSQITLTGNATCLGTANYRFLIVTPAGSSTTVQDFGPANTFTWSAGGPAGVYTLEVDAKESTAATSTMSWARVTYKITACYGATLTTAPASPASPGASIVLTAGATCDGTPQYRFWINNGTNRLVQDWSPSNTYTWDTTGLPYLQYGLRVDVRNTGSTVTPYESVAMQQYVIQAPPCTTPTVTVTVVSPQGPGAGVNITASTTTCPNPVYQFWLLTGTSTWTVVQAYSSNPTLLWLPGTRPAGTYQFSVWVRDATRLGINQFALGTEDAYSNVSYNYAPCSSTTMATTPDSTALATTTVQIAAQSTGCTNALYEFWILPPGSTSWKVVQPYSSNASYSWSTAGPLPAGTYHLSVWVRDASSPGAYVSNLGGFDANFGMAYVLTSTPCSSVSLSPSHASPASAGATVTFTGVAAGCPNPLYSFWVRGPGMAWTQTQAYGTSPTFAWSTAGLKAGTYYVSVWTRDTTSSGTLGNLDANAAIPFVLTAVPCTSAGITPAPQSPAVSGASVTFTASASGCPNARYEFWMRPASSSTWAVVQPYSSTSTLTWDSSRHPGSYYFSVWAKDASSLTSTFDANATTAYKVTPASCSSVTLATSQSGSQVTFTATASGCSNSNPLFEFWMLKGSTWVVVQGWSTTTTWTWDTTGVAPGTYRFSVWVRDASSVSAYDAFSGASFTV